MKKTAFAVLALLLGLCALTACNKAETPDISMYALSRAMLSAMETEDEMLYVSASDDGAEEKFAYLSDMDYGDVKDFFLLYAENGKGNADELAVICVKNPRDAAAAEASLRAHLSKRVALYQTYDPSQLYKLENAVCETVDGCSVLIVAENAAAVRSAYRGFLSEKTDK